MSWHRLLKPSSSFCPFLRKAIIALSFVNFHQISLSLCSPPSSPSHTNQNSREKKESRAGTSAASRRSSPVPVCRAAASGRFKPLTISIQCRLARLVYYPLTALRLPSHSPFSPFEAKRNTVSSLRHAVHTTKYTTSPPPQLVVQETLDGFPLSFSRLLSLPPLPEVVGRRGSPIRHHSQHHHHARCMVQSASTSFWSVTAANLWMDSRPTKVRSACLTWGMGST